MDLNQNTQQPPLDVATVKPEVQFTENDNIYRIVSFDNEATLDTSLEEVTQFITNPDNSGVGLDELAKDALYAQGQGKLNEFKVKLRDARFNFHVDREQYKVLTSLLNHKLEYDVNSLFIALELVEMLENMHGAKFQENEIHEYPVTATEITYVYHLLAQHKVKGLTKEAKTLAQILIRIGEISKLISYYDSSSKNLVDDITNWALGMNGNPDVIDVHLPEVVEPTDDGGPQL